MPPPLFIPPGSYTPSPVVPGQPSAPVFVPPAATPYPGPPGTPTAPVFVPPGIPNPSQSHAPSPFFSGLPAVPVAAFEFHPSLLLREEYSDNFFLEPGRGTENFRTTIGPGFSLFANTARTQGTVSGRLDIAFDTADSNQKQNFFPNLNANIQHELTPRLKLTLLDSLSSSDDASQLDRSGLRAPERRQFYSNTLTVSADWLIDQIATRAFYTNVATIGSTASGRSQNLSDNQMSHIIGLGASAPIAVDNTVRLNYELSVSSGTTDSVGHFISAQFDRRINPYTSAGISTSLSTQSFEDSRIYNVSLYTSYALPSGFSVSGSLGYSWFQSTSSRNDSGISANTTVSYLFGRVLASLSVFQDYRQTFTQGEDAGIVLSRTVTAAVSAPITAATSGSITLAYSENEPTGAGNNRNFEKTKFLFGSISFSSILFTAGVRGSRGENQLLGPINNPTGQARETITLGAFVSIPLGTWLSLQLDYNYLDRDDGQGLPRTKENRAGATLQASF